MSETTTTNRSSAIVENPPKKVWRAGTLTYSSAGLAAVFAWLLFGDFAWSMRDRSVGPMAQWYLNHLNVPNLLFGLLISTFPAVIGVIIGPIISVKSDRHRGRWGRRIPFLLVTTPIAAFGMIGIAVTPVVAKWVHGHFPEQSEMVVALICFGVFWAAFEFATIASQSVFGGLINDVVPKELLGRFYGLFRAVSLIDGMIFNYWIMGHVPTHFTLILCAIGATYCGAFLWVCFKVKEGRYPPPPPAPEKKAGGFGGRFAAVRSYCKECFTNPYYLSLFVLLKVAFMAFGPVNTFAIPYARSLGIGMEVYGKFLSLTFFISLCLSWFLGWLADVFHPLRMALVMLSAYVVLSVWAVFNVSSEGTFLVAWVAHGVISGSYFTSAASLGQRLFPHSKYAQFASAAGIFTSFANMTLAPLVGLVIDQTGGVFRYCFGIGGGMAVVALAAGWHVHRKFMQLGGPRGYVAPE